MSLVKEDVLIRIVDLKNLLVFKEWYAEVVELMNEQNKNGKQLDVEFESRSAMTDLFYYGLLCFPPKWTTFSSKWLKYQLKNFRATFKPWLKNHHYESEKQYKDFIKSSKNSMPDALKHYKKYFGIFISAIEDDEHKLYKQFKNNRITDAKKRKILSEYLKLLNSYENEKIPLWKECEDIRLIIYSMLN